MEQQARQHTGGISDPTPDRKRKEDKQDVLDMSEKSKTAKNVFIVFCHWEHKSFNGALLEVAKRTLKKEGHNVVVSDLYEMNFNPVLSKGDIKGNGSPFLNYRAFFLTTNPWG